MKQIIKSVTIYFYGTFPPPDDVQDGNKDT